MRDEKELPDSLPEPGTMSKIFRDLSMFKVLFKSRSEVLGKKDRNLATFTYLSAFTRVNIDVLKKQGQLPIDFQTLTKYSKSLIKLSQRQGFSWKSIITEKSDTKAEILACVYAHCKDEDHDSFQSDSRSDKTDTKIQRRISDPSDNFDKDVKKARAELSRNLN